MHADPLETPPDGAAPMRLPPRRPGERGDGLSAQLAALLPTRIEAAVARAVGESEGRLARRLEELRDDLASTSGTAARIERDLVAERLGRIEDLETLVELLATTLSAVRADLSGLQARVDELTGALETPLQVTFRRPGRQPA